MSDSPLTILSNRLPVTVSLRSGRVRVTPSSGSLVEDTGDSLAWHYRLSDPLYAEEEAIRLKAAIADVFPHGEIGPMSGRKVVEARPRDPHTNLHEGSDGARRNDVGGVSDYGQS